MIFTNNSMVFIEKFAVWGPYIFRANQFYRLLTAAFIHGGITHLLFNVYALYVIGSQIESLNINPINKFINIIGII